LQEYDLHIHHISGTNNFLADALSRSPAGLNEQIKDLSAPREIMIATLKLDIDQSVGRKLKELASLQEQDTRLQAIRQEQDTRLQAIRQIVLDRPEQNTDMYMIRQRILYCKGDGS
jgi:hypothetical protein